MLETFDWVAVQCTPGVKPGPFAIIVGPALKGFVAGVLMGAFVRKVLSSEGGGVAEGHGGTYIQVCDTTVRSRVASELA
jgi:hypothetical protein